MKPPIRLTQAAFAALTLLTLTACSSKPGNRDIAQSLAQVYQCPLWEVTDVDKLDGVAGEGNRYGVTFSFKLGVKGSPQVAAENIFEQWYLQAQQDRLQPELTNAMQTVRLEKLHDGSFSPQTFDRDLEADPTYRGLMVISNKLTSRMKAVMPCDLNEHPAEVGPVIDLARLTGDKILSGKPEIAIPIGFKIHGEGTLVKGESGWHFVQEPKVAIEDVIESPPMKFAPLAPPVSSATPPSGTEKTLIGALKQGRFASCLEVVGGNAAKCYSFLSDSPMAKIIFASCSNGEQCAVTGQFDEEKDDLRSLRSAAKAGPGQ